MSPQFGPGHGDSAGMITDPVTGAYSRALLDARLAEEIARARRAGSPLSVWLFDLDHFKSVNDAFGHARGDLVLRQTVELVAAMTRTSDVLFRYGGDEFVLLLPDTEKLPAYDVALRVVSAIAQEPFPGEPALSVSISLGVSCYPEDATDPAALVAVADRRSYLAKQRGRACVVADDDSTGLTPSSSRLLERDDAMATAQSFLGRLTASGAGALGVAGERGAGHTHFIDQVAAIAGLRGLEVVSARTATPPPSVDGIVNAGGGVLVVADGAAAWAEGARLLAAYRAATPAAVGLVFSAADADLTLANWEVPVLDTVELTPWSTAALRIWLRTTLRGEPSEALVDWLAGISRGLPARALRALNRLRDRGGLDRTPGGGWTVSEPVVGDGDRTHHRLPVPLTALVGRAAEVEDVVELLRSSRLVTLLGPGGIGKTRMALAVARAMDDHFDDGVAFVSLGDATTVDLVTYAVAQALDVDEVAGEPLRQTLAEAQATRRLLLVLDNFEQVLEAAVFVGELLAGAPGVNALVTSRERLRLSGERVYQVPSLTLPATDQLRADERSVDLVERSSSAVALFVARAHAASYGFRLTPGNLLAVAELCHRLDALPLAIELAAARIDEFEPHELLAQLSQRLDLLADGPRDLPQRQQTLRATIDWSVALLQPPDADLLTRLGVFSGGCRDAALAAVCAPDCAPDCAPGTLARRLETLVEKSLLRAEPDGAGGARYWLLETTRAYAAERLAGSTEARVMHARHADYFMDFAEVAAEALRGPDRVPWLGRVEAEYGNLRSALRWTLNHGEPATAARIAIGLYRFWHNGNHISESRAWVDEILAAPDLPDPLRLQALDHATWLALDQGDHPPALVRANECLELARRLGDRPAAAEALCAMGNMASCAGQYDVARDRLEEALALRRAEGDLAGIADALGQVGETVFYAGDLEAAAQLARETLAMERELEHVRGILLGINQLAEVLIVQNDTAAARPLLEECLALSRQSSHRFGEATALHNLGRIADIEGDLADAAALIAAAVALHHRLGFPMELAAALEGLGGLLTDAQPVVAARLFGAADGLRLRHGFALHPVWRPAWEAGVSRLRDQLPDQRLTTAWNAGRTAPLEAIIAEVAAFDAVVLRTPRPADEPDNDDRTRVYLLKA